MVRLFICLCDGRAYQDLTIIVFFCWDYWTVVHIYSNRHRLERCHVGHVFLHSHGQDRNRIIVKLRTLVQELPSYVEGGKEVDCTHHLQLIQGYLHALGLGTVTRSESTASNASGGAGKALTATSFPSQAFIRKYYILKGGLHNIDGVSYRIGFSP